MITVDGENCYCSDKETLQVLYLLKSFKLDCYDGLIRKMEKIMNKKSSMATGFFQTETNSLGCYPPVAVPVPDPCKAMEALAPKNKQQENKMYELYDDDGMLRPTVTPDERKAAFLVDQLSAAYSTKSSALYTDFHMAGTPAPKTPKEFVDMLKTGKFAFGKAYLNDDGSWRDENDHPYFYTDSVSRYLRWDDPATRPDQAGFDAATEKMNAAEQEATRTIRIGTPVEGLAALKDFESKTFH